MNKAQLTALIFSLLCGAMICKNLGSEIFESLDKKPTKDVFKTWHFAFKRPYDLNSEEGLKRYRVFKDNIEYIKKVNSEQNSFKLGLGPFADITFEEYTQKFTYRGSNEEKLQSKSDINEIAMSDYFLDDIDPEWMEGLPDHTDKIVTYPNARLRENESYVERRCFLDGDYQIVKTMYEAHINIRKLPFHEISYQNFYDCADYTKGEACGYGTTPLLLWQHYVRKGGIYTKESYPMLEKPEDKQDCKDQQIKPDFSSEITGCAAIDSPCTLKIKRKILKAGPAITRINNEKEFQHYVSGIFDSKRCNNLQNDLVMGLIVHLTKDKVKVLFPYGQDYGDQGFVYLSREFTMRRVMFQFDRYYHSCGAESEMAVPHQLKYLKGDDTDDE